jgi:trigger factor
MTDKNATVGDEQDTAESAVAQGAEDATEAGAEDALSDEESLQEKLKAVLGVQIEDIGPLRKQVTITVPRDAIDEQLNEQFDELRQEADVPGFRKGRAPQKLIRKRFGHEVGDQVGSSLIGNAYLAAVERESLAVLGDPLLRVKVTEKRRDGGSNREVEAEKLLPVDEALKHMPLPNEGDLVYTCEVDIKPEFDLPSLEEIPVERPQFKVADEDVEAEIRRRMALRGKFVPVEDGVAQTDDVLVGAARVTVDGDAIHSEDNAELAVRDQTYDGLPLFGFGKAATGKKVGGVVGVELTVPDDYTHVDARGKPARFELTVTQVKRLEVPELDDDYLASLGYDSAEEFREVIREAMERAVDNHVRRHMCGQIEKYLLDNTQMELPQGISQRHTERIVSRRMMEFYSQGVPEAEIFKQLDELRTRASEQAADELRYTFIMSKIAEDQEISVSEEEINAAIADIAHRRGRRFDRVRDEIIGTNNLPTLYSRLRDEKILDRLLAGAVVTEKAIGEQETHDKEADGPPAKKKAKREQKSESKDAS